MPQGAIIWVKEGFERSLYCLWGVRMACEFSKEWCKWTEKERDVNLKKDITELMEGVCRALFTAARLKNTVHVYMPSPRVVSVVAGVPEVRFDGDPLPCLPPQDSYHRYDNLWLKID